MKKNLVIVESPTKAKTIGKFLGRKYKVMASVGHVRDLPKSKLGVDIENNFEPRYITIRGKGPVVKELRDQAKKSDKIFLATDPDREGEAISWHLAHILGIDSEEKVRVEFNEITKDAIKKAISNSRVLDQDLVDSQQARRVLDRLVGYQISPLLWQNVRKGLSAGRVQSVVVKIICDREKEIENFQPEEYWSIKAILNKEKLDFEANFVGKIIDSKEEKLKLNNKNDVDNILKTIDKNNFKVTNIRKGTRKRNPYNPFTTSTLQQEASRKLGFSTRKTMSIAQQLYEGIDLKKEGTIGLITYMRTDSTRVSDEIVKETKAYISKEFGKNYSNGGSTYRGKTKKQSQDAHEAIRPTSVLKTPLSIQKLLSKDQFRLYELIWNRFVASQMKAAVYDTMAVTIHSNDNIFKTNGSILKFDGFLKIYSLTENNEKDVRLPNLKEGEKLKLVELNTNQHFTQAPPRYTEASLIKLLEELGIGRPSTYSPTISTILSRGYVELNNKVFTPTELGIIVNDILEKHFLNIMNIEFTAKLEDELDSIADGDKEWKVVISDFYEGFEVLLKKAEEEIVKLNLTEEVTEELCSQCGLNMVIKHGRYGKFLACSGFPDCKNTKAILEEIGVACPDCGSPLVRRRSKKGRLFYGCSSFPKCKFVSWNEPVNKKCPNCGKILVKRVTKKGSFLKCIDKECGFEKNQDK